MSTAVKPSCKSWAFDNIGRWMTPKEESKGNKCLRDETDLFYSRYPLEWTALSHRMNAPVHSRRQGSYSWELSLYTTYTGVHTAP